MTFWDNNFLSKSGERGTHKKQKLLESDQGENGQILIKNDLTQNRKGERAQSYFCPIKQGGEVISVGLHEDSFQLVSEQDTNDSDWLV